MNAVTPMMAPQVSVEGRADMVKLMEESNKLIVKIWIENRRKAESHHEKLSRRAEEVPLHAIGCPPTTPNKPPASKAQGCDAGLEPVQAMRACLRSREKHL